jgi:hypothetical protein
MFAESLKFQAAGLAGPSAVHLAAQFLARPRAGLRHLAYAAPCAVTPREPGVSDWFSLKT